MKKDLGDGCFLIEEDLAVTHKNFFRGIARALGSDAFVVEGNKVILNGEGRCLEVTYLEESERRLGGFLIPLTPIKIHFSGYSREQMDDAWALFFRRFQRGGG
jgi:hypothetical protein